MGPNLQYRPANCFAQKTSSCLKHDPYIIPRIFERDGCQWRGQV